MKTFSIIGAGSWGTALAMVLSDNGYHVLIHTKNNKIAKEINDFHTNKHYLKEITLPETITATTSFDEALNFSDDVLIVVPSHAVRDISKQISSLIKENHIISHATKGIENGSLKLMSQIISEEIPHYSISNIITLSGPSHAEEVAKKIPTTLVSASLNQRSAEHIQHAFTNQYFRVYTDNDIVGVELGGALKNIISLGAGLSDGLGFGDNGKAALLTRGLSEMVRLGVKLGAHKETFSGLSGMGDLIVTSTSKHSRNWRTGYMLSQGLSLQESLDQLGMVAEGVKTTKSAYDLAKRLNIETPIINELYEILFEGKNPNKAAKDLFDRDYKPERNFY